MAEAGGKWHGLIGQDRAGRKWPAESRLFGAYLVSGPAANRIGCFALDVGNAAAETGLPIDRIREILIEFAADGFAHIDQGWVWIPEILLRDPFLDPDEVRRTLPLLAAVPRDANFHPELVRAFRTSADRPGVPQTTEPNWLVDLVGDNRSAELAQRLASFSERIRRNLPGLPRLDAVRLQPIAQVAINIADYAKRWRHYLIEIVNVPALRLLGLLFIFFAIVFVVFPGIDIGVARWFFDPPRSFALGDTWVGRFFDTWIHYGMEWFIPVIVAAFLYGMFRGHPIWHLTPRNFLFVALSVALGAGLLTNVVLKDTWGRARPSQVSEFGGPKHFSPAFMRATQCDRNCSFVSGDAALAASFMSFAVIADRHRKRWWAGLGTFTAVVGIMRMARGSHFLSDVVFAVILTLMVMFVLARLILAEKWRDWPRPWQKDESLASGLSRDDNLTFR